MEIKITGCGDCPFRYKYRNEWECHFKLGKVVKNLSNQFAEWCPMLIEDIVFKKAEVEND